MSMHLPVKLTMCLTIILMVGACSFKKGNNSKDEQQNLSANNVVIEKKKFCLNADTQIIEDFQTLISLSTSQNEKDLCTSVLNFQRKHASQKLLSSDTEIFNSLIRTAANLARTLDISERKSYFLDFATWATNFSINSDNADRNALIRFNNLISNPTANIPLIDKDFADRKVLIFKDTDHLSQKEFLNYLDGLASSLTIASVCGDAAMTLALRTKKINSHTLSLLERCRSHQSPQLVVANRRYLSEPVDPEEVQLLNIAIKNRLLFSTSDEISKSTILATITLSVKQNDIGLFKLAALAFKESAVTLYGLAMAKTIQYDLHRFIKENPSSISETLRALWTPQEVINALNSPDSPVLFDLFSQNDVIPSSQQSEMILKEISQTRRAKPTAIDPKILESFIRLLKSNTATNFRLHFKQLNLADEEVNLIVTGYGSNFELAQLLGVNFSSLDKIYFQKINSGTPAYSVSKPTKLYITGSLFSKMYFPQHYSGSGEEQGIGYQTDNENSFYLTVRDSISTPIPELPAKIMWGPDYALSISRKSEKKDVPVEVSSTFSSIAEYARREFKSNSPD